MHTKMGPGTEIMKLTSIEWLQDTVLHVTLTRQEPVVLRMEAWGDEPHDRVELTLPPESATWDVVLPPIETALENGLEAYLII